jgi:hypothetical protein
MCSGDKLDNIAKAFFKQIENAGRLTLDVNLAKRVDVQREEIEKEIIGKVKKSLSNVRCIHFLMFLGLCK